jgi:hypothetical protein
MGAAQMGMKARKPGVDTDISGVDGTGASFERSYDASTGTTSGGFGDFSGTWPQGEQPQWERAGFTSEAEYEQHLLYQVAPK